MLTQAAGTRRDPLLTDVFGDHGYKTLGPCVISGVLGSGGAGTVYRARHLNLEMDVAVKCLEPGVMKRNEKSLARFQREARIAARINHPNVTRVYELSECDGLHYLVMEYVEGENARQRVARKGPLSVDEGLKIAMGAARGLAEAHRHDTVHRDVKPDNILISSRGEVKITDMGLAKSLTDPVELTQEKSRLGTPRYMPPEQWEGTKNVSTATDVWALGASLYFLLAGEDAIKGESIPEVWLNIGTRKFPSIEEKRKDVPEDVKALIERATRRDPSKRYSSARELLEALEECMKNAAVDLGDPEAVFRMSRSPMVSPPPERALAQMNFSLDSVHKYRRNASSSGIDEQVTTIMCSSDMINIPQDRASYLPDGGICCREAGKAIPVQ